MVRFFRVGEACERDGPGVLAWPAKAWFSDRTNPRECIILVEQDEPDQEERARPSNLTNHARRCLYSGGNDAWAARAAVEVELPPAVLRT